MMKTRDRWSDRWRDGGERRRRLAIRVGQRGRRAAQGNGARAAKVRTRAVEQVPRTDWMARTARRRASRGGGASRLPDQGQSPIELSSQSGGYNPWAAQRNDSFDWDWAPRPLKNFANQVKAPAIDALLENAIITASWRDVETVECAWECMLHNSSCRPFRTGDLRGVRFWRWALGLAGSAAQHA